MKKIYILTYSILFLLITNLTAHAEAFYSSADRTDPEVPTLISPSNGSNIPDRTLTLDWSDSPGAYCYELKYETRGWFDEVTITDLDTSQYTIQNNLKVNKTYYWWVKAIDQAGNESAWTDKWTFILSNDPPKVPGRLWIENITNNSVIIHWAQSTDPQGDPITYELQYSKDWTDYVWKSSSPKTTIETSITLNELDSNQEYDVRVRSIDPYNHSDWNMKQDLFGTLDKARMMPTSLKRDFEYSEGNATDGTIALGNRIPVILVHGNNSDLRPASLNYWYWWVSDKYFNSELYMDIFKVYRYVYDSSKDIADNGTEFANFILAYPELQNHKVLIIAHSMGGLVVRSALNSSEDLRKKTIKLITLGTPHLGSPLLNPCWVYLTAEPYLDEEVVEWLFVKTFKGTEGEFGAAWHNQGEVPTSVENYIDEVLSDLPISQQLLLNSMASPLTGTNNMGSPISDSLISPFGGYLGEYEIDGMGEDLSLPIDVWNEVHTIGVVINLLSDHQGLFLFANPVLDAIHKADDITYFNKNDGFVPLESALINSHPDVKVINITDLLDVYLDHSSYLDVPSVMDYIWSYILRELNIHP